jgi:SAM-dependent methyltransferase
MSYRLSRYRKIWQQKKILRKIYQHWYEEIICDLKQGPGKIIEIGSGTGNFKEYMPNSISSDIEKSSWLDMCFDAHHIPFKKNSVSNIIMIDVLHHLENPLKFLKEAARVLEPGGRLIMNEPYPSFFSSIIYRVFHPEPFLMNIDYFKLQTKKSDPWKSNQAIPYLLFFKQKLKLMKALENKFKIKKINKMSFILYPASGGFENRSLIPNILIPLFFTFEKLLSPFAKFLAFRCYIVLEKK